MPLLRPAGAGRLSIRLLLIRHAESQGNFERRLQGRREFPLTERGLAHAQALAERLVSLPLSAVYSSPVGRAIQTAEVIAAEACLDVIAEPRLQEYDFGEAVSGLTWPEIREKEPAVIEAFRSGGADFPAPPREGGGTPLPDPGRAPEYANFARHEGRQEVAGRY